MTRADSAADSPMADHVDNDLYPMDLGDDWHMPYRILVYGGGDGNYADIVWREELRFHHELADSDAAKLGERNAQYKPWPHYTDDSGMWLTAENESILVDELKRLTGIEDIETAEDGDPDGDDGYIAFSIRTDYRDGETVAEWVDRIGWHVIATLTNATDPGTFNYPYLFSAMLYREES